ncbi:MAG: glycosyltransferase family 4 protein [Endomicrobiales bacterium]|jgi:glycosyltransferase involved in cell wall biosynthesis
MPIKVCHIITRLELGGAQQNTLYTVRHLSQSMYTPFLITGTGGMLDSEAAMDTRFTTFFIPELVRSIFPWDDLIAAVKIWKILRTLKPSVVHTHSSKAGILGRWAAWCAGVPVIIHTVHGFGFTDQQWPPVRIAFIMLERLTALITDKLVVVAAQDQKKGLAHRIGNEKKYIVIRSGIDIETYKTTFVDRDAVKSELGISSSAKVVTTIGPFKPQKNLSDFVRVASAITRVRSDCVFLVVGDGDQRGMLEEMSAQSGLCGRIHFLGWRNDTVRILGITDVFVMTSLWEGLPRSIVEAMCRGVPVVANAVDGIREIVQTGITGHLVEPYAVGEMTRMIIQILDDPAGSQVMGEAGRRSIGREFDINCMVEQQENLYQSLLASFEH